MFSNIQRQNTERKIKILSPFIKNIKGSLLDFGCGDLSLSEGIYNLNSKLQITGIDVVEFPHWSKVVAFLKYDGKKIPFKEKTFDFVIVYHVLHHTSDPQMMFKECLRVTKYKLLLIEPVYRNIFEIPGMMIMDFIFNAWKEKSIAMSFKFKNLSWWKQQIALNGWKIKMIKDVEILPKFLPTGRSLLIEIVK